MVTRLARCTFFPSRSFNCMRKQTTKQYLPTLLTYTTYLEMGTYIEPKINRPDQPGI